MQTLGVSPGTVRLAMESLTREGVLEARPGVGTFVATKVLAPVAPNSGGLAWQSLALGSSRDIATEALDDFATVPAREALVLNAGYLPEELQPLNLLNKAATRALQRPEVWARSAIEGLGPLRAWFAAETSQAYQPHQVLICPGTQGALAAAFRALATAGEAVLLESPTYAGAIAAARSAGLRPVPVPTDDSGVQPDMLAEAFRMSGARLFYCQPCYANPTGSVLAPERRRGVLDIVARHGAFLIEDDWARDFHLEPGQMPPPLAQGDPGGHVVYLRSLTKCAAPGVRVGALCAHGAALARLRHARLIDDFFVPGYLQEVVLQLVTASAWPQHLRQLRSALRIRRDALIAALSQHFGGDCLSLIPSGGLHLWLRLPPGVSDREVQRLAAEKGVLVSPGCHWFPAEPPESFLRLSFAAATPEQIETGIPMLAQAVQDASS